MHQVLAMASEIDLRQSPPAMAQRIHRVLRQLTENGDPYREIKQRFNRLALELYPRLKRLVVQSNTPLETAVRLAIAGNVIDFGVSSLLREIDLETAIDECLKAEIPRMELKLFWEAIEEAEKILYIADNAGEIVFDRVLIEQLPTEKVTAAVRGQPVINDATTEDAKLAGLTEIVEVIDNGSDAPGTILASCSEDFRQRFADADLIIAKGQGNYESLSDLDKNMFFILRVKCSVLTRDLGCEQGEMILVGSKTVRQEQADAGI